MSSRLEVWDKGGRRMICRLPVTCARIDGLVSSPLDYNLGNLGKAQ